MRCLMSTEPDNGIVTVPGPAPLRAVNVTLRLPKSPTTVVGKLARKRILPGVPLRTYDRAHADCLLVAVTEQRTREEIDG